MASDLSYSTTLGASFDHRPLTVFTDAQRRQEIVDFYPTREKPCTRSPLCKEAYYI